MNGYIKDRDIGPGDYIAAGEKSVKVDLYRISIIAIDILNGLDIIIFADIVYCFIFLVNVVLAKCFRFKRIYLDKEYNQLYKKRVI